MTRLSVNINKIATLRNARGGNIPDVLKAAVDCERFGAQGITVHPRPDERHIRYQDVLDLRPLIKTEFNIEGYPSRRFLDLVKKVKPHQVTLVPDAPDALTSNQGWDTRKHLNFLTGVISELKKTGIRTSLFTDTKRETIEYAAKTGTDRIELYTEPYASAYRHNPARAVKPFAEASHLAHSLGLEVNAGHDLNLENLKFFCRSVPYLEEVSIGHALISDALYFGLENTIQLYLRQLR
ncbi:MAG: pyridoxine 5'-phosphate synthase [Bacteroidales bacterium]